MTDLALVDAALSARWASMPPGSERPRATLSLVLLWIPAFIIVCKLDSHTKKLSHLVALHSFIGEPNKVYSFEIHTISSKGLGGGSVDFSLSAIDEDERRMLISAFPESKASVK